MDFDFLTDCASTSPGGAATRSCSPRPTSRRDELIAVLRRRAAAEQPAATCCSTSCSTAELLPRPGPGDAEPILRGAARPRRSSRTAAQWATFLRNHDEIDLSRLTAEQRAEVFADVRPGPDMQLYGRGIRRRLAPMLGGDRRRLRLAYALQFTLPRHPGAPVRRGDRDGRRPVAAGPRRDPHADAVGGRARTPGFSTAESWCGRSSAAATSATEVNVDRPARTTRARC